MKLTALVVLRDTFRRFNEDKCWNSAIIISYFAFLCAVPLVSLFVYITSKLVGTSELALRSLNLFSDDFFVRYDPSFFKRIEGISSNLSNLGWFGLIGSLVAASFLFSNLIYTINYIFRTRYQRSFVYNRIIEYSIMFVLGIILLTSLAITALWTAIHRSIEESSFISRYVNPEVVSLLNNYLIQYVLPLALSFLVFFTLYKFIPETRVFTGPAAVAAGICAVFWEIFKRGFAVYVANFSAIGVVLSKLVQGTLTSIIFFLLWISFSLVIVLWGAELAAVLNERRLVKAA
jgi:membrane protein